MNLFPALVPRSSGQRRPSHPLLPEATFQIRAVARADAALLMALCDAQRAECGEDRAAFGPGNGAVLELMEALFEPPLRAWAWIARERAGAVGYAAATIGFSMLERAYYLRLESLYVDSAWRGRGVESELLQAARALAQQLGCVNLQWQDGAHLVPLTVAEAVPRRASGYVLPLSGHASS